VSDAGFGFASVAGFSAGLSDDFSLEDDSLSLAAFVFREP
jgi:hypothetical protein